MLRVTFTSGDETHADDTDNQTDDKFPQASPQSNGLHAYPYIMWRIDTQ